MKLIIAIAMVLSSLTSFADEQMKAESFAKVKEMILSNIDKRIALSQTHKSCVSAAADANAMKACREQHKQAMKSLKSERHAMKSHFKEEMKDKRAEHRKNKDDAKSN